jgi:hypothetical protein
LPLGGLRFCGTARGQTLGRRPGGFVEAPRPGFVGLRACARSSRAFVSYEGLPRYFAGEES